MRAGTYSFLGVSGMRFEICKGGGVKVREPEVKPLGYKSGTTQYSVI